LPSLQPSRLPVVALASPAFASPPSPPRKLPVVTFGHRSYAELTTGFGGCAALFCDKCQAFGACQCRGYAV